MDVLAALILGIVQGLTEFLPVSSSAHLILVPWLFGWDPGGLVFDVALHVGTSIAVLVYFWRDWLELARETILGLLRREPFGNLQRRLAWFLVVGTLPALVFGLTLEKWIEEEWRSPIITVFTLVFFGGLLYYGEKKGTQARRVEDFVWADSIWIGMSQALALIPGVSRSGITITTAMLRGVKRTDAARYSFLLSTPVIVGAGLLHGWQYYKEAIRHPLGGALVQSAQNTLPHGAALAVGVLSAAVTGVICIKYFLLYIQTRTFTPFVLYRMVLAGVVLLFFFTR